MMSIVGEQRTIYIRDADTELWRRAEAYAKAHRMPVSGLILAALEAYLDDEQDAQGEQGKQPPA